MEKKKGNHKKNKQRNPIYYGINLEIEEERKLLETVQNSIDIINSNFKEDFISTYEDISELIKKYDEAKKGNEDNKKQNNIIEVNKLKYPKSFHITLAFGGKKGFDKNSKAVIEFNSGLEVDIKILGVVIVPNKMVIVPVNGDFYTENEFAHFTTFVGDLKPVQSNDILENIFSKGMIMEEDYNKIVEKKVEECCKKIKVKIEGEEFDGFVYLTNKNESLIGRMKEYYF
jgi:hypothetical protein